MDLDREKGAQRRTWIPKRVRKGRHLGSQNIAKINQKKRCYIQSEKVTSWSRLSAILNRCLRRLGVKNVDFLLFFKVFVKKHVFDQDECSRAI